MNFSPSNIELLEKIVDALSVYMGKPVLAEIGTTDDGYEWVAFGLPLENDDNIDENITAMQMGGPSARLIGGSAFLEDFNRYVYQCEFLWGIQIGEAPLRFTLIDHKGDENDWSDTLTDLLPFALTDDNLLASPTDLEEDDEESYEPPYNPKQYH